MTTVISNNVIKIPSKTSSRANPALTSTNPEYPRTCDYCRDTYNSELTYNRHKETGKCFRFCRLREEKRAQPSKSSKRSIYPRMCELCSKVYKNKHSYYKHKFRCNGPPIGDIEIDPTSPSSAADVVELAKEDDIENIPITDNKENIDDFSSKFILTLDVDENYSESHSLFPKICEICHKVFKTEELFESHKLSPRCSESGTKKKIVKTSPPTKQSASRFFSCEKCDRIIYHKLLYNNHIKRCGKSVNSNASALKKAPDFDAAEGTQESQPNSGAPTTTEFSPLTLSYYRRCSSCGTGFDSKSKFYRHCCTFKAASEAAKKSMYPRTCEYCGFVFENKVYFLRHKPECPGYQDELLEVDEDSYVPCDSCSIPFDSLYLYRQHMKYVHPNIKKVEVPEIHKYMYPRKCLKCFNVYMSRQTFCNHKKKCALFIDTHIMENVVKEPEIRIDENAEKLTYPRTCNLCQRTYSNRQSFCNHKKLCPDFIGLAKETTMHPIRCKFCLKLFSSKQIYHHHKCSSVNFKGNLFKKTLPLYPRTCKRCNRTFAYKQIYSRHIKKCLPVKETISKEEKNVFDEEKIVFYEENGFSDGNMDHSDFDVNPEPSLQRQKLYPRMCPVCRRIYANRYTFCKHKQHCVSTTAFVDIAEDEDSTKPLSEEPVVYPKECENCLGTFKNATTFNAHKIRCDFFDTKINETEYKTNFKSDCEHCRNIVGQYRRILHQHLAQCTDPIVVDFDPLSVVEQGPPPTKLELTEEANFCECCGVFFESREQLEYHNSLQAESSLFQCDICMETFDFEDELADHKSRCVLNTGNKTYPRFCECCKKIYKSKQTFYNHKKNCHVHCLKYFVLKDCENCKLPFKCEKMYFEHQQTCVGFDDGAIAAECEVFTKPEDENITDEIID